MGPCNIQNQTCMAQVDFLHGRVEEAEAKFAAAKTDPASPFWMVALALLGMGVCKYDRGHVMQARKLFEEARGICRREGFVTSKVYGALLSNLGLWHAQHGS